MHAEVAATGLGHPQPVEALGRVGELDAARQVDAAALSALGFDLPVQVHRVLLQSGNVRIAVQRVHAAGRVPGAAGSQLCLLDQDHVGPSRLGEVVEHAGADDSAADHHDLCR